jgi:peptide/nickel transport system ATP-binding protein
MTASSPATPPARPSPTILRIEGLRVAYRGPRGGRVQALEGLDLSLGPGCAVALVGESGSGKSTAVAAVMGLLPRDAEAGGTIQVGDRAPSQAGRATPRALRGREVGFVGQQSFAAFDPLFPVGFQLREAFGAHGRGDGRGAVEAALAAAGLEGQGEALAEAPHRWSGGMLQRAQLAAALLHRPSLLVADEPTSALDPVLAARLAATLAALKAGGTAVLLATHDLGLASVLADEVVVLRDGRVVERGTAAEILGNPREAYTRALLAAHPSRGLEVPDDTGAP